MSSYFDALTSKIATLSEECMDDAEFLAEVVGIERETFDTIKYVTGDVEFPNDLRERIMGIFAVFGIFHEEEVLANPKVVRRVLASHYSPLIEALHDAFHDVARRRHQTRFCAYLSDNPAHILAARDLHDCEAAASVYYANEASGNVS